MSNIVSTTRRAADTPIRFGVIGAGFIARWFAEAVAREPGAQIEAVTSAHRERAEAFAACSQIVEEVKERLPVWKRQTFTDGSSQWSNIA